MGEKHRDIHVVHVTLSVQGGVGGPARSVVALCQGLSQHGCRVDLVASDWGRAFGEPIPIDTRGMQVHTAKGFLWKRRGYGALRASVDSCAGLPPELT